MTTPESDSLLRTALRANAGFSGLCGVTALIAASSLQASLGIEDERLLPVTGVSLVFFCGLLVFLVTRKIIKPAFAMAIVVMDVLWVLTTPVPLLLSGWLTGLGVGVIVALSLVVLTFAGLQYAGIRQMRVAAS
jgi:hypothetical protein